MPLNYAFQGFVKDLEQHEFRDFIKSSKYGPRFDAKDYDINGNVKTIRGTDVSLDATIKYEQAPIANLPQSMIDEHRLQNGDILMITTADCGLSAVFEKQEMPYIASAYAVRICLNEKMDSHWAKYYLQTNHITNEVNKYIRKGTLSNLPLSDISRFIVNVPALKEQTKIAEFLSAVDDKISQLSRQHELLNQYKKGVMQKIFSQEIRFKNDNGEDFGEWDFVELGEICDLITKGTTPTSIGGNFIDQGINFIKIESITENGNFIREKFAFIDEGTNKLLNRSILKENDILFSIAGALGRVAIVDSSILPANTNQALAIIRLKNKDFTKFIYYFLNSEKIKKLIENESVQLAQANFSLGQLSKIEIALPSIQEQAKIAEFLTAIDERIDHTTAQLTHTKQWKKGLLQQMFV